MRRGLKSLGWIAFGILALLVDLVAVLHLPEGQEFLRFSVEREVGKRFKGEVKLGSLELDLSGALAIRNLRFESEGQELLEIGHVRVELDGLPTSDGIEVASVDVEGLHVHQGTGKPRLEGLFIPPEEKPPKGAVEPSVTIQALRISDANVEDLRPDGTSVKIMRLHGEGKARVDGGKATFEFQVPSGHGRAEVVRPDGGLFTLPDLQLAITGKADPETQTLDLQMPQQRMPLVIRVPELKPLEGEVSLSGLAATLRPGSAKLDLQGLRITDLLLERLMADLQGGPDGTLMGRQALKIVGLKLPERIINEATGQASVVGPVVVNFEGAGPAEHVQVQGNLSASTGLMRLVGEFDLTKPTRPTYRLDLSGEERGGRPATDAVSKEAENPQAFEVGVIGQGILPGETQATLTVKVNTARLGLPVDEVNVKGATDGKSVTLDIAILDQKITVQGNRNPSDDSFSMTMTTGTELTELLAKLQASGLFTAPPIPLFGEKIAVNITAKGKLPKSASIIPEIEVQGEVSANDIRQGRSHVDKLSLTTNLRVVEGKPKGALNLRFEGVQVGPLRLGSVQFILTIDGTAYGVEGLVLGQGKERIGTFKANGEVDLVKKTFSARVSELKVEHSGLGLSLEEPVSLEVPAGLELAAKGLTIPPVRLRVGDGKLVAGGTLRFATQRKEGQAHDVLVLSDSDIELRLDRLKPPLSPAARSAIGLKVVPQASGTIRVQGAPGNPFVSVDLQTRLGRYRLNSKGKIQNQRLTLQTDLSRKGRRRLATLALEAPLPTKPSQRLRSLSLDWELHNLPLADFIKLEKMGIANDARLRGQGRLKGTLNAPRGEWSLSLSGSKGVRIPAFSFTSEGDISSRDGSMRIRVANEHQLEGLPKLRTSAQARFAKSPLLHPKTRVSGTFGLDSVSLSDFGLKGLSGIVSVQGEFMKAGRKVRAAVNLKGQGIKHGDLKQPLGIEGRLELDPKGVHLSGRLGTDAIDWVTVAGNILGDIEHAVRRRRAESLPVSLTLTSPRQTVQKLRRLIPVIPPLDGDISGLLKVNGTLAKPEIDGRWAWEGFQVASGETGRVEAILKGTKERLDLLVRAGSQGAFSLRGQMTPTAQSSLSLLTTFSAQEVRIADLVPANLLPPDSKALGGKISGQFDFDMEANPASKVVTIRDATGDMHFEIDNLPLADTGRRFERIQATLSVEKDGLQIGPLMIREADVQEANRKLTLNGKLFWDAFRPSHFEGRTTLRKWLSGGPLHAPHGELDADIALTADLKGPAPRVVVDFESFDFEGPKRFLRDHYQEVFGENDVVYIDDEREVGRLPPSKIPFPFNLPEAGSGQKLDLPLPSVDLRLVFSKPARANAVPLVLRFTGALDIRVRPDGITGSGALTPSEGSLGLMGHPFAFKDGAITMNGALVDGAAKLTFRRVPSVFACRDARTVKGACEPVDATLHITPLGGIQLSFEGASGPYMVDAMALQNTGHARWMSGPGQGSSSTVQFPQTDDYLIISWVMGNVAHLSGLDLYRAWSDPYSLDSYGRMTHYEGVSLLGEGTKRLSLRGRPATAGQNQLELGYDFLFGKAGRRLWGVGFHLGDELYTGAELFYEWSSDN